MDWQSEMMPLVRSRSGAMPAAAFFGQSVGLSAGRGVTGVGRIGRIDPRPPLHAPCAIPNTRLSALMCLSDPRHAPASFSC